MAIDYAQSAALMKNPAFVDRVKVACVKFANFILIDPATPEAAAWAKLTLRSPDTVAQTVAVPAVLDPQVQQDGEAIADNGLQGAVEPAATKYFS